MWEVDKGQDSCHGSGAQNQSRAFTEPQTTKSFYLSPSQHPHDLAFRQILSSIIKAHNHQILSSISPQPPPPRVQRTPTGGIHWTPHDLQPNITPYPHKKHQQAKVGNTTGHTIGDRFFKDKIHLKRRRKKGILALIKQNIKNSARLC